MKIENCISIHDRAALRWEVHQKIAAVIIARHKHLGLPPPSSDLIIQEAERAVVAADKRYRRKYHGVSRYRPHQGKKECARRAKQLYF